ncbi:MAG: hypothetical protein FWD43_05695, partial [Coriobacteriia bacterium]|nr:hypothetical protein [Coriobacteriia bacterium]
CGVEIIINRPNIDTASLTKAMYDAQMTVREGDKIIFLATDRNELAWAQSADIQVSDDYTCRKYFSKREANRILVLGYDEAFDSTVVALEEHYSKTATGPDDINCSIKLVYRKKRENRVRSARLKFLDSEFIRGKHGVELEQSHGADSEMKRIKDIQIGTTQISFQCARQDYFDIHILESILFSGEQYDHIVVLSDLSAAKEDADTETLLTLLYLRAISENAKKGVYAGVELAPFNITSEIQNMENVNLAYNEYVSDYIISWKFIASLQVQIAVDKNLYKILRDILKSGHADVRLEPVTHFVKPGFFDNGDMSALKDDIGALADAPVAGTPKAVAATPAAVAAHDVCVPVDLDAIAYKMRTIDDISEKRLLLGYTHGDDDYVLNPSRDENGRRVALLSQDDQLIVLANDL